MKEKSKTWPALPDDPAKRKAFLSNKEKVTEAVHLVDFTSILKSAAKFRDGSNQRKRENFMRAHGFELEKGEHYTCRHPLLKAYASFHNIDIPANLWNINTSKQDVGYESVDMDGKGASFNGTVRRVEWVVKAIENRLKANFALKQIKQEARGLTEDRREKTLLQRRLCQKFKEAGVKGAQEFLKEVKPELNEITDRIEYRQMAIQAAREVMQQRTGDISMRKPR